jgi:Spy/CpxP family protein refolding chaperone
MAAIASIEDWTAQQRTTLEHLVKTKLGRSAVTAGSRVTRVAALILGLLAAAASAAAQTAQATPVVAPGSAQSPAPLSTPGGPGRTAQQAPANPVTNVQVQVLFDAYVVSQSQRALQLSNQQFEVFLPKLLVLQQAQRQHRNQRNKALAELRALVGPKAPPGVDEASIAAATKALDDLEAQMQQDEQRALGALDAVLTTRQRAHFRLFLENMEREKVNLLIQAKGREVPTPAPAQSGRGGGR